METSETQTIGERINLTRKKRNLSIQELADKAGCSSEYLEWIENDEVYPPVALLLQLAKALRVGRLQVGLHHVADLRGTEAMQVDRVLDRNLDRGVEGFLV